MDFANYWFQAPAGGHQIGNSLRFRGGQRLTRTPASAGNRQTYTVSVWVKTVGYRVSGNWGQAIFSAAQNASGGNPHTFSFIQTDSKLWYANSRPDAINDTKFVTNALYRDPSAWTHFVYQVDQTKGLVRIWQNGVAITSFSEHTGPTTAGIAWNNNVFHSIGSFGADNYFNGYMAEFHNIDGQALAATDFGEFNADGVWVPKKVSGVTYGTNGFYLD